MDKPQGSEVDKFFEALPKEDARIVDPLSQSSQAPVPAKEDEDDPEKVDESVKNRRHRRLEERLQAEREANIALTERLKMTSDIAKIMQQPESQVDPRLLRAFGTNEAGQEAAQVFQQLLSETAEKARQNTLQEIEQQGVTQSKEQSKYESFIDTQLESIEDKYGVDLTSDSPKAVKMNNEFLTLIEQLSPKDQSGTITDYADFDSAFKVYQSTHQEEKPDNTRARQVASRSMQRSGGTGAPSAPTPGFHGWMKDYGL